MGRRGWGGGDICAPSFPSLGPNFFRSTRDSLYIVANVARLRACILVAR